MERTKRSLCDLKVEQMKVNGSGCRILAESTMRITVINQSECRPCTPTVANINGYDKWRLASIGMAITTHGNRLTRWPVGCGIRTTICQVSMTIHGGVIEATIYCCCMPDQQSHKGFWCLTGNPKAHDTQTAWSQSSQWSSSTGQNYYQNPGRKSTGECAGTSRLQLWSPWSTTARGDWFFGFSGSKQ